MEKREWAFFTGTPRGPTRRSSPWQAAGAVSETLDESPWQLGRQGSRLALVRWRRCVSTKPDLVGILYSILRFRRVGREAILEFQNRHLRRLLAHAYRNVPYYRRLFERSGIAPEDIRSVADLQAIPITSKADLRAVPVQDTLARGVNPRRLIAFRTSGSSGEPFVIRRTGFEERLQDLYWIRATHYFGHRARDRVASLRIFQEGDRRIRHALRRRLCVDCYIPPEKIVQILRRHRPDSLGGYPGTLSLVAEVIARDGCRDIRPRLVIAGAEVLTRRMREQITEAFGARVYNWYGSREFNCIGWECKETGEFHTCDDNVIVEILKDGRPARPGESGELVGTALHSFAMPFIRYRLADVVTSGSETCACGEPFSTIRDVQGRMIDRFVLPAGRFLHPGEIIKAMSDGHPWIGRYQIFQERKDRIVLRVVPRVEPTREEILRAEAALKAIVGPDVESQVILVPEIELGASGKFRIARSLVSACRDGSDREDESADQAARPVGGS